MDWRVVGAVVVGLAALAGLAWWWFARRRHRSAGEAEETRWAIELLHRLEALGAARGRPRDPGEPVEAYGRALSAGPLPGPQAADLADLLSDALYGPPRHDPDAQQRAEAILALLAAPVGADA